jgi:uncharacterized repeat protein (TIGR02543 family)
MKTLEKRFGIRSIYFISLLCIVLGSVSCSDKEEQKTVYTVIFDTGGGTPVQSQTVEQGNTVVAPANPQKQGYVFLFWHLNGINTAYNFQTPVNSHITLYAKWEEEAKVEYWQVSWSLNGGSWPTNSNHTTQVVKSGTLSEPNAPTKAGSNFDGWYKEAALTNKVTFPYDVSGVTENFTLYAKWMTAMTADDPNLETAVYALGWAARVSSDYNDKGLKPSNILLPGTTNQVAVSISYLPNGALDRIYMFKPGSGGFVHSYVYYRIDNGRRPCITTSPLSTKEASTAAMTSVGNGTYSYATDPAQVIAYFGNWMGSAKFTSLDNLKLIANNNAITEAIYNSISFPTNCYKMIVYGKNNAGTLIGKYFGYSLDGRTYFYVCIDPASTQFGQRSSKNTPIF